MSVSKQQVSTEEWVTFPGGQLEGKRPSVLCPTCREALKREAAGGPPMAGPRRSGPLCFACYRADLARTQALKDAGELDTASDARFQSQLPFEPVNHARLETLKAARAAARSVDRAGIGQYADRRRRAQLEARHALQAIAVGLRARHLTPAAEAQGIASAIHAAELQLPEAWLPYVVSR